MALMDAKEYDPRPEQRRNRLILIAVLLVIVGGLTWWFLRFWPEEHVVNRFFQAVEAKNFEGAYGIYFADPDWKQHPDKHKQYTFNQFLLDWGPSGDHGAITSHHIECAAEPPKSGFASASGVIVVVRVNNVADPQELLMLWVEKKTKTITTSYLPVKCR